MENKEATKLKFNLLTYLIVLILAQDKKAFSQLF